MELIDQTEFLEVLKRRRKERPLTTFAPELGVTHQFLAKVVAGDYKPGPRIAQALGYKQVIAFQRVHKKEFKEKAPAPKTKKLKTGMKATEFSPEKMQG